MADGLQMRRLFLAGFWQVSCLLNAQATKGKAGEVGKPLRRFKGGARQSPQQIRKALLGCFPVSDEGGFILAKGAGSETFTLLALCGVGLKVFWTRSSIRVSDRVTQPKPPLLFLTMFSKNVLYVGSQKLDISQCKYCGSLTSHQVEFLPQAAGGDMECQSNLCTLTWPQD